MMYLMKRQERAIFDLRSLYSRYGYGPYKMSRFEEYDLYVRNKDFLVSDQIITFSGDRGQLLALKPDVTLSIVKNAPEEPGVIQKVYYNENVYRDYREILQAGLECVGDLGDYEIAEVVLLAVKSLQLLGGKFVLDISHMGLIAAVLESCGFDGAGRKQAMQLLRRKSSHELKALCCENAAAWEKLEALLTCRSLPKLEAVLVAPAERAALGELKSLLALLPGEGVRLDFSVGSDLGYYSGVVFRGFLEGVPAPVLSGGQYDKLPRKMGRNARAIGFAIYLDLLQGEESLMDVDTVILHDGTVDTAKLMAAAQEAAETGSVLVCTTLPKNRSWKRKVMLKEGQL